MEKKQKEAERSRRNRRKRKNEFERNKEFYEYATENNMPFVQEFEVKRQRRQQQEQPVLEEQQPELVDDIRQFGSGRRYRRYIRC